MRATSSIAALLLPALLALGLLACAEEGKKKGKAKAETPKAPVELSWQIRQVRLNEPCRAGAILPAATPAPAAPAAPAPTPPPPAAGDSPADPAAEATAPPVAPAAPAEIPPCVRFFATYPEFEKGMPRALLHRLNDAVKELATSPSFDERRAGSLDGTGRKLIAAWKARIQEKPGEATALWYDERKVSILYRDAQVISFRFEERLKAGGAHELATVLYVSYSLDRIDRLSMADLFLEGSAQKLNELGEKKFRQLRGIAPGRSLADAGFDFPAGLFRLSGNFAVTADGLVFRYNPYDVGPFALGETEVVLPLAEIQDLLRPKGPLGERLAGDGAATQPAAPGSPPAAAPGSPPAADPAATASGDSGDSDESGKSGDEEGMGGG